MLAATPLTFVFLFLFVACFPFLVLPFYKKFLPSFICGGRCDPLLFFVRNKNAFPYLSWVRGRRCLGRAENFFPLLSVRPSLSPNPRISSAIDRCSYLIRFAVGPRSQRLPVFEK